MALLRAWKQTGEQQICLMEDGLNTAPQTAQ
jgi:hypothetical protein